MDSYIRPYMDEEGFIPIAYLCNFPNVASCGAKYEDILAALDVRSADPKCTVDVDRPNELVRVKGNFKMWLIPSAQGLGLPKYVKQPVQAPAPAANTLPSPTAAMAQILAQSPQAILE